MFNYSELLVEWAAVFGSAIIPGTLLISIDKILLFLCPPHCGQRSWSATHLKQSESRSRTHSPNFFQLKLFISNPQLLSLQFEWICWWCFSSCYCKGHAVWENIGYCKTKTAPSFFSHSLQSVNSLTVSYTHSMVDGMHEPALHVPLFIDIILWVGHIP